MTLLHPETARRGGDTVVAEAPVRNVYVQLNDAPYAYGEVLERRRVVDYAADGTPIGVEFVAVDGCASVAALPSPELIAEALRSHDINVCEC